MKRECRFCREFGYLVEADKQSDELLNGFRSDGVRFRTVYRACMQSVLRKRDDETGKYFDKGKTTYGGYALKYCPSCWVKLKK